MQISRSKIFLLFFFFIHSSYSWADVVKPALVELTLYSDGNYQLDMRLSIEAMLTGINAQYKNTQEAPNAAEYDELRALESKDLEAVFLKHQQSFIQQLGLSFDGGKVSTEISSVSVPEPGYKKIPRISELELRGVIPDGITVFNWFYPEAYGDNAFRYRHYVEDDYTWSDWQWLRNGADTGQISLADGYAPLPILQVVWSYMKIGYAHILPLGLDHILFILGIFLLSIKMQPLVWQVTAFTLAHTLTLGLAMQGLISLPASIVEPLIALSIAYVGIENLVLNKLHAWRVVIVFLFGLLHGLGFASVLKDFGMPEGDFLTALVSFNVGVEIGQLSIILGAFLIAWQFKKSRLDYRRWIVVPCSLLIAVTGLFWTVDRVINA